MPHQITIAIAVLGALVLALSFLSVTIERFPVLSRPIVALAVGVLLGPVGLGWFTPPSWGLPEDKVLEIAANLTMAIALMGVALRLPRGYFKRRWRSQTLLLGVIMPMMWVSASLMVYLVLDLPIGVAFLIGAVVTPTDPVLATNVVHGRVAEERLPERLRHLISAESGANDGLAYPFVLLLIFLLTKSQSKALTDWIVEGVLVGVAGGVVLGTLLGQAVGRTMSKGEAYGTMEQSSILAITLALSLLTLGLGELLQVNGILAVFVAGLAFDGVVSLKDRKEEEKVQESVNQFFTVPIFALFGMTLPWGEWARIGAPTLSLLVAAILLVRRLPGMLLIARLVPSFKAKDDAILVGWFGPIGVAALLYATTSVAKTGQQEVWTIVSAVICGSVIVHGMTTEPLTRIYKRRQESSPQLQIEP